MPIAIQRDGDKYYFQFGRTSAHYLFNPSSEKSRSVTFDKCLRQAAAIMVKRSK